MESADRSARSRQDTLVIETLSIDVELEGFYKILTTVHFDNSTDLDSIDCSMIDRNTRGASKCQLNETFYLLIIDQNGAIHYPVDANIDAGGGVGYKVVVDDSLASSVRDSTVHKDAGTFFFRKGINKIVLYHYSRLAQSYPIFIHGGGIDGPESMEISLLLLSYARLVVQHLQEIETDTSIVINGRTVPAVAAGDARRGVLGRLHGFEQSRGHAAGSARHATNCRGLAHGGDLHFALCVVCSRIFCAARKTGLGHFDLHHDLLHRAAVYSLAARLAVPLADVFRRHLAFGAGLRRYPGVHHFE